MKKFTLMIVAALLATVSFAQKPVPTPLVKSFTGGKQISSEVNWQSRSIENTGKAKKSPRKAPEDYVIISEQPAGELVKYTRSGSYLYVQSQSLYVGSQSGEVNIVFGADNKVYIQNPLMGFDVGTWVEGTLQGDKLVVSVPQNLYYSSDYDACIALIPIDNYSSADESTTEITYTVTDETISLDDFTSYSRTLGAYWTDDHTLQVYGEYNTVFTKGGLEVVTPPEDLAVEEYFIKARNYNDDADVSQPVFIGFDGNDVYVKGFSTMLPDAWVKGTMDGNTITFAPDQYLGNYGNTYDVYFNHLMGEDVVFTYDAEAGTFTCQNEFFLVDNESYYFDSYRFAVISKVVEKAAMPAAPSITALTKTTNYGYLIEFNIPLVDVDGNPLVSSKLSYEIFTDVEGTISPLTFTSATHEMLSEDMTAIPYGFTDNYDFFAEYLYLNDLYSDEWNRIGIKSIYTGGGETNETEISWFEVKPYAVSLTAKSVDNENFYATYYDSKYARVADENTTVYTAALNSSNTALVLTEVEGNVIPAGNAVVLKSSAETIKLAYSAAAAAKLANNVLEGSDEAQTVDPSTYYVLSAKDDVVGFYLFAGTQLAANKAYVPASAVASSAKVLVFGDDATGINTLQSEASELNHVWYTIQGVRVSQPTKGVFINNGKKIILK